MTRITIRLTERKYVALGTITFLAGRTCEEIDGTQVVNALCPAAISKALLNSGTDVGLEGNQVCEGAGMIH